MDQFKRYIIDNPRRVVVLISSLFLISLFYVLFFYSGKENPNPSPKGTVVEYHRGLKYLKAADSLLKAGENYQAVTNYRQASSLLVHDSLFRVKGLLYKNLGNCYVQTDQTAEALKVLFKGLSIVKDRDKEVQAKIDLEISRAYRKKGLFLEAEKKLLEAQKFFATNPRKYNVPLVKTYIDLSSIYQMDKRANKSLAPLLKAKQISKDTNSLDYAAVLANIGIYYFTENQIDTGLYYTNKAAEISFRLKDSTTISGYYANLSGVDMLNNEVRSAIENSKRSLTYIPKSKGNNNQYLYLTNYLNLADEYEAVGDYKNANIYNKKRQLFLDSLYSLKAIKYVADIENDYRIRRKDDELKQAGLKNKILSVESNNRQKQKYILIAVLVLISTLFLYGFRLFLSRQKQHKLNEEILERDKQLLGKELEIVRKKVEYDSQLISEKEALIADLEEKLTTTVLDEKEQQEMLSIIESMKDGLKQERESIGVDIMLNEENVKFYKKLKDKHPDISQTEARFCTLLYLNLDTKEIARILNISLDGVRKGRHRLRKKLDIGTGGDITNYLQGI